MKRRLSDVWWSIIPWVLQTIVWIPAQIILRFFLHFRVEGYERIKHVHGPVIFVSNHTSFWDPILVAAALPFLSRFYPMLYVAREHAYYYRMNKFIPIWAFQIWGAHPAEGGKRDYAATLAWHAGMVKRGRSLCVFPEGKRGRLHPDLEEFKGGIGYLAYETNATIVPVGITGVFGMKQKDFWTRKRHAHLIFGDPILCANVCTAANPTVEDFKHIATLLKERVGDYIKA
jgi:1-acyl-sn-glycerol-3-phosphate acyltransferase